MFCDCGNSASDDDVDRPTDNEQHRRGSESPERLEFLGRHRRHGTEWRRRHFRMATPLPTRRFHDKPTPKWEEGPTPTGDIRADQSERRLYNDSILQYYRRAGLRRCDVDIEYEFVTCAGYTPACERCYPVVEWQSIRRGLTMR